MMQNSEKIFDKELAKEEGGASRPQEPAEL
jgi:hypothetical protein